MPRKNSFEAGVSKVEHSAEDAKLAHWHELKETAPGQATYEISSIGGFSEMSLEEKRDVIKDLLSTLNGNQENRALFEEIARQFSEIETKELRERHLQELGVAA